MAEFGIYLYLIILIIRPQDWIAPFMGVPVHDLLIPVILVAGYLECAAHGKKASSLQLYLMCLFTVIAVLSNLANGNKEMAAVQLLGYSKQTLVFLMMCLALNDTGKIRRVLKFTVLLTVFLVFQGILQSIRGTDWAGQTLTPKYTEIRIRWIGDWDGPNVLALLFIISIGISMEFMFGPWGFFTRFLYAVYGGMLVYGVMLTNSRGGWLAIFLMVFLYFYERTKKIYAFIIIGVCMLGFLAVAPSRMTKVHSGESSAHERVWAWEQGIAILRADPVFGVGKGMFAHNVFPPLKAHNNYVQVFAEVGLPGFYIWLAIPYLCGSGLYKLHRLAKQRETDRQTREDVSLGRALLLSLIGFSAATFFVTMELEILVTLWGMCTAMLLSVQKTCPEIRPGKIDFIMIGGLQIIIIGMVYLAAIVRII